jgi:bifunctional lysine-specific demethylase and histidyl-hydroxylase NO66
LVSLPLERFAAEVWGSKALLSPAATLPAGFDDLFSLEAADELLSRRGLRTPFLRIAKDGAIVDPARFTTSGGVGALIADQVADDQVLGLFATGHTMVLQGLHRLWPPLVELAGDLTDQLGHPVQINAYITPSASQGFSAHYDVHDVFVLQIAGRKRWVVHDPVHVDPLRTQPWTDHARRVAERASESPAIDAELGPGDVLYLPRGFVHAAEALRETCMHLTIGIHTHTRHLIVEALAGIAADDPALRRSLPLGIDVRDAAQLEKEVAATVEALIERLGSVGATEVAQALGRRTARDTRPAPLRPLAEADALTRLSPEDTISVRRNLRVSVLVVGDELRLDLSGRTLRLPVAAQAAVEALLETGGAIRIGELPGLTSDKALELARDLIRFGVVVSQQPADGD